MLECLGGGGGRAPGVSGGCCGQAASALVFIRFHSKQKSPFHHGAGGSLVICWSVLAWTQAGTSPSAGVF